MNDIKDLYFKELDYRGRGIEEDDLQNFKKSASINGIWKAPLRWMNQSFSSTPIRIVLKTNKKIRELAQNPEKPVLAAGYPGHWR